MAGICTAISICAGGNHATLSEVLDGVPVSVDITEGEALEPLSADDLRAFLRLKARRLRQSGVPLAQFVNRVLMGDEATNVKQYDLMGPGSVVTKTNIGTAYVNVLPGANGERCLIDFTGCAEFRPVVTANLVGTGPFGFRIIKDGDNTVLFENASVALTGERELDPGWQAIPAGFTGLEVVRLQAKSVTASDDPVIRRASVLVR
jgi:hypothetical protein